MLADELLGVITKVDADAKKITVVEKDTDKEIEVKITDETEYVTKKGTGKVDFEKAGKKPRESQGEREPRESPSRSPTRRALPRRSKCRRRRPRTEDESPAGQLAGREARHLLPAKSSLNRSDLIQQVGSLISLSRASRMILAMISAVLGSSSANGKKTRPRC